MTYTAEQIQKLHTNIQKIVAYIETDILPYITYSYETANFGPIETWGRMNERRGQRYYIALNGPYADKIRFYHGTIYANAEELAERYPDIAVNILRYWQDAKSYMNAEVGNCSDIAKLINNFEI